MKDEVKNTKINVVCNSCGKVFTTNIGWAMKRKGNLVCSKCSKNNNIEITDGIDVEKAIEILKGYGLKIQ